jgi:hypothetical protein
MQKASVGFERAKDADKELRKEQKRAERAEKENAEYSLLLKEARAESEMLKGENGDLRRKLEEVEHGLREQLAAAESKAEAEYDRAVEVITDNYRAQMPAVKDAVWEMAWQRCLSKLGVDESSPHWTDMELPSVVAAAQARLADQPPPNPEAESEPLLEQTPVEGAIANDAAEGNDGGNLDSTLATDASRLGEEA